MQKRRLFFYIFGFNPALYGNRTKKKEEQDFIDEIIAEHARRFFAVANHQEVILEYIKEHSGYGRDHVILESLVKAVYRCFSEMEIRTFFIDFKTLDDLVSFLEGEVDSLKRKFFYAWKVAKYFGFNVKKEIEDYRL